MKLKVGNMKCGGCVSNVKQKLEQLEGVTAVTVDLASASANVEGDVDPDLVIDTLTEAGYPTDLADE
jgi:copper chaperone CopZ